MHLFISTSGMQRVAGVMEINSECREVFIDHTAGHNEFIYLILGLFCFALSIPCGTQKWESEKAHLKRFNGLLCILGFKITSSANREKPLSTKSSFNEIALGQHNTNFMS